MNVWIKIAARVAVAVLWEARLIDPYLRERSELDDEERGPSERQDQGSRLKVRRQRTPTLDT